MHLAAIRSLGIVESKIREKGPETVDKMQRKPKEEVQIQLRK
jgi:hypothetical protein